MMRPIFAVFMFLASAAFSDSTVQDERDVLAVIAEIQPQANGPIETHCVKDGPCTLTWTPKAGPAVFSDRAVFRAQAVALAKKLKAGTITAAEKDTLLLRLCFLLLSSDQ